MTLSKHVSAKMGAMSAPRLVEYWEQDQCRGNDDGVVEGVSVPLTRAATMAEDKAAADYGVKIEAQFAVGEYIIVILSSKESTGLDRYLRAQKYQIPKGA